MPSPKSASDPLVLAVQTALKAKGFDPGPLDGEPGRRTTAAVVDFQKAEQLPIKWPGTIGPTTLAALGIRPAGDISPLPVSVARPWLDLALRKKGLSENKDYAALSKFLRSDGDTLGDPRKLPWCGDFVETCIALTCPHEALPGNPYLARNWTRFGVHCPPQLGAVAEFWRGSKKGTDGHVAIMVGIGPNVFYILGGNQKNSVSIVPIARDRLLDTRWPSTFPLPATTYLPVMKGGTLSLNEA